MNIKINTDNGTAEPFTIILSSRDKRHFGELLNVTGIKYITYLNHMQELSFNVNKYVNGIRERLWDEINNLRLVYVKELNTYFEINVLINDNDFNLKSVNGISLCESELSQKLIYNLEINTELDISRTDYEITKFFNPGNPKASLLHRVLSEAPAYKIKHVDASLATMQRSFSVNDKSIYDFLTEDCANEFECLFQFDSVDRSVSVYDLCTVCNDCGYRGNFTDSCPVCHSNNINYFGEDTTILVSSDNLTDEITFETDVDNIKNCFVLEAGDDTMTAAVMSYIPSGRNRMFYIPPEQQKDMPVELVEKIRSYNLLYDSSIDNYHKITEHIYECIERITYHTSKLMPEITIPDTTASTEAAKLTASNLSPLSLSSLTSYTSLATINSALINYAKVFVRSGFVKIEVDTSSFQLNESNGTFASGVWTGRLKVTSYSNKEDIAFSDTISITVNDDYQSFISEKILKNIASNNTDDNSVYHVLGIKDIAFFRDTLKLYCLNRLISFRDAINSVLSILLEANAGTEDSELYSPFYAKYYDKLQVCNKEITLRKSEIESWEKKKEQYESQKQEIQRRLDFRNYLGPSLYQIFTTYIRESKYSNSNYISDGLSDEKIFERALEFIETARKELIKSSYYQHSIHTNLYNLLLMKEFSPIVDKFQLGNFIRVRVDDNIYRLRLVSYEINFDSLGTLNTDFSDMTKTAHGSNDIHDILKQASSIASTYSYVSKQASNGHAAQNTLINFVKDGLNSALVNIKNNNNEEILLDKNGLIAQSYDDITGDYSPEKLRLTHNLLVYTSDNFKTVRCALGKHDYYKYVNDVLSKYTDYGLTADFVTAGVVNGSQIIAGNIYSANYSAADNKGTKICLDNGNFTLGDGKIVYDGKVLKIKGVEIDWSTTNESQSMWAKINANADSIIAEYNRATNEEGRLSGLLSVAADEIKAEVTRATNEEGRLSSLISTTADGITAKVKEIEKRGDELSSSLEMTSKKIDLKVSQGEISSMISQESDKITITSNRLSIQSDYFTLSEDGTITANSALIGGLTVTENSFGTVDDIISIHKTGDWALRIGERISCEHEMSWDYPQDQFEMCVGHEGNIYAQYTVVKGLHIMDREENEWGSISMLGKSFIFDPSVDEFPQVNGRPVNGPSIAYVEIIESDDGETETYIRQKVRSSVSIWADEWGLAIRADEGEINFYPDSSGLSPKNRCNFYIPAYFKSDVYIHGKKALTSANFSYDESTQTLNILL